MTKEELIKEVAELETKLFNYKGKISNILDTATDLIRGININNYSGSSVRKIQNLNEFFYEIGKLVSFREETLSNIQYERNKENDKNKILRLENELKKIQSNYE